MKAPTVMGAAVARPERTSPNPDQKLPEGGHDLLDHRAPERAWVEISSAGRENMMLATTAPTAPPAAWAPT